MIKPLQRSLLELRNLHLRVFPEPLLTWPHGHLHRLVIVAHGSPYPVQHLMGEMVAHGSRVTMIGTIHGNSSSAPEGWSVLVSSHAAVLLQKSYARRHISYIYIYIHVTKYPMQNASKCGQATWLPTWAGSNTLPLHPFPKFGSRWSVHSLKYQESIGCSIFQGQILLIFSPSHMLFSFEAQAQAIRFDFLS